MVKMKLQTSILIEKYLSAFFCHWVVSFPLSSEELNARYCLLILLATQLVTVEINIR